MVSDSLLVKIPSYPFNLDTLRPDAYLAKLAGHLVEGGHRTKVMDFGTLEMLGRLFPESLHGSVVEGVDRQCTEGVVRNGGSRWGGWWSGRTSYELEQHHESVWREVAQQIIEQKQLDFVLFSLDNERDRLICEHIVPLIRNARPHLILAGTGRLFQQESAHLPPCVPLFDCVYWGSSGDAFMRWVNILTTREHWDQIPFLAYSDGVRMYMTKSERRDIEIEEIRPNYSREVYPALYDETKILYFDIEEVGDKCPSETVHVKSPARVVEEIKILSEQFKTLVFHVSGCSAEYRHAAGLANEILNRHLNIRYTRECHIATLPSSMIGALSASGCYGVDFQIDTGSQRLLDNYYGNPFGVTQVEQTVRTCTFSGLFTLMRFSYPCVEDDYHTMAETLRLIQRSKPHGTKVSIPLQEDRKRTDLKARFESPQKVRSESEIQRDHADLCRVVEEHGISTDMTLSLALMAELSGYRGQEEEFLEQTTYQFLTGDVPGIEAMIDRINRASEKASNAIAFRPFNRLQHVVGN